MPVRGHRLSVQLWLLRAVVWRTVRESLKPSPAQCQQRLWVGSGLDQGLSICKYLYHPSSEISLTNIRQVHPHLRILLRRDIPSAGIPAISASRRFQLEKRGALAYLHEHFRDKEVQRWLLTSRSSSSTYACLAGCIMTVVLRETEGIYCTQAPRKSLKIRCPRSVKYITRYL